MTYRISISMTHHLLGRAIRPCDAVRLDKWRSGKARSAYTPNRREARYRRRQRKNGQIRL